MVDLENKAKDLVNGLEMVLIDNPDNPVVVDLLNKASEFINYCQSMNKPDFAIDTLMYCKQYAQANSLDYLESKFDSQIKNINSYMESRQPDKVDPKKLAEEIATKFNDIWNRLMGQRLSEDDCVQIQSSIKVVMDECGQYPNIINGDMLDRISDLATTQRVIVQAYEDLARGDLSEEDLDDIYHKLNDAKNYLMDNPPAISEEQRDMLVSQIQRKINGIDNKEIDNPDNQILDEITEKINQGWNHLCRDDLDQDDLSWIANQIQQAEEDCFSSDLNTDDKNRFLEVFRKQKDLAEANYNYLESNLDPASLESLIRQFKSIFDSIDQHKDMMSPMQYDTISNMIDHHIKDMKAQVELVDAFRY